MGMSDHASSSALLPSRLCLDKVFFLDGLPNSSFILVLHSNVPATGALSICVVALPMIST